MHLTLKPFATTLGGLWLLSAAYGCSHVDVKEIPDSANPSDEIARLDAERATAVTQQVDVLSPQNYRDSAKALSAARASRDSGADSKAILHDVAESRAYLDKAREVAKISRTTMPQVVQERADAQAANAGDLMGKDFREADKNLTDVTEKIEGSDLSAAEHDRDKLAAQYATIELAAIKLDKLGPARTTIAQAEKEGATANSPRTAAQANKAVTDADAFITAHRHDKAGVQAQSTAATAAANRLMNISRQVKVATNTDSESVVLDREAQNNQLSAQTNATKAEAAALATSTAAGAALQAANGKLDQDAQAGARLDAAKAQFSPDEANVYRDGTRLIIRLKTLAFPTGKSNLQPGSFPVLGKVQKVIADLGPSHVTIEGHTDSVGNAAKNQKLSDERAAAIASYLTSNGLKASDISTVGYGDTKPIAANNTAEGRAQNRRVDVIIEPNSVAH